MSDKANGYAAKTSSNKLELIEYKLKNFEPNEVEIEIDHCGVCGTDVSYINNKFGITNYPFIGGHEIVGRITKVGSNITDFDIGAKVGVGFFRGFCNECSCCNDGNENILLIDDFVDSRWTFTIVGGMLRKFGYTVYPFTLGMVK